MWTRRKRRCCLSMDETVVTGPHHIWPSLSEVQWLMVEVTLKGFLISDYAEKNNVNEFRLTQSEMRDIILGYKAMLNLGICCIILDIWNFGL